jgi:hypothetical protein
VVVVLKRYLTTRIPSYNVVFSLQRGDMKDLPGFSVNYRNPGHWDIGSRQHGRSFAIRGGPGRVVVRDERLRPDQGRPDSLVFKTVQAAMIYITDILMFELIVVEGQEPEVIKSWNI